MLISVCPSPDDHNNGMDVEKELFYIETTIEMKELLYFLSTEAIFIIQETVQRLRSYVQGIYIIL